MTTLREAAIQALDALEGGADSWQLVGPAIDALKAVLVEPVQEPVAWMTVRLNVPIQTTARKDVADEWLKWGEVLPLYAAPPQRKPLTEEEIGIICKKAREDAEAGWPYGPNYVLLTIRGVERAHGIT